MRVVWLILLATATACGPHRVTLPTPKPNLTQAERLEAYSQLRPAARRVPVVVAFDNRVFVEGRPSLILNGGHEVEHPADLLPWVRSDSPLREHVARFEKEDASARRWQAPFWISAGVGLPVAFAGLASIAGDEPSGPTIAVVGLGCLATSIVFQLIASGARSAAEEARQTAFRGFDQALQQTLNLYEDADQVRPCEVPRAPPPPAPAAPPLPWRKPAPTEPALVPGPSDAPAVDEPLEPVDESEL